MAVCLSIAAVWFAGRQFWGISQYRAAERAMNWRDYSEARRRLAHCLQLWPTDGNTLLLAARAANRDGDVPEGNRLLRAARTFAPEDAQLEQMVFQLRMGDMGDAAGMLAACESHIDDPQSKLIMEGLIEGALQTSQLELAQSCLTLWDQTQKEPWDTAQAAAWRGELAFRQGFPDVALGHFREAVEASPANEQARLRLADELRRATETPPERLRQFAHIGHLRPGNIERRCRRRDIGQCA